MIPFAYLDITLTANEGTGYPSAIWTGALDGAVAALEEHFCADDPDVQIWIENRPSREGSITVRLSPRPAGPGGGGTDG